MRGSVIPRLKGRLAAVVALSVVAIALQGSRWLSAAPLTALPSSLIGIALPIFAGFRNSACYERWWDGRKVWAQALVDVRSLTRQALVYDAHGDPDQARTPALRTAAFLHALHDRLRGEPLGPSALALLPEPERQRLAAAENPPNLILRALSSNIAVWLAQECLDPRMAMLMEERVVALSSALAAGERLKGTPIPFTCSLLLHRTVTLFCLLLPFGLAPSTGLWTPLAVAIVSYTFFGPDALARTAEIDVMELLGEAERPPALRPAEHILL